MGDVQMTHSLKLSRCIRNDIRAITRIGKYEYVNKEMYSYLKILPYDSNITLLQDEFMWSLVSGKAPTSIFPSVRFSV